MLRLSLSMSTRNARLLVPSTTSTAAASHTYTTILQHTTTGFQSSSSPFSSASASAVECNNEPIENPPSKAKDKKSPWAHLNVNRPKPQKHSGNNNGNERNKNRSSQRKKNENVNTSFRNLSNNRKQQQQQQQKQQQISNTSKTTISNNKRTNNNNNNLSTPTKKIEQQKEIPNHGIDKLRDSFMQSLQSDRQRRQQTNRNNQNTPESSTATTNSGGNGRNTNNTESKLDQLLRMSRLHMNNNTNHNQRHNNANNNTNNHDGNHNYQNFNYNNNTSGAKGFRERRKLQQQQQYQNKRGANHHNNNNNNNNQNQNGRYNRNLVNTDKLQQQLLNSNSIMTSHENERNHNSNSDEDDGSVVLPRRELTLVELSTLLRVPKEKIIKTIRSLEGKDAIPRHMLRNSSSARSDQESNVYKVDTDLSELIALELGMDPQRAKRYNCEVNDAERRILRKEDDDDDDMDDEIVKGMNEDLPKRPPVVVIMGHVDHGKTTLMDCLRQRALEASGGAKNANKKQKTKKKKKGKHKSNNDDEISKVAGTEAGGITQVVSAFQVDLPAIDEDSTIDRVTFLDTPGHAAFKAMRQSGSNGADVIVLVIAADDGISPQTVEIIDMYKTIARAQPGSIDLVVAMTKIDKPGIDVDESIMRIENQLIEHDIMTENMSNGNEEFGGVQIIPVSGLTGDGLDNLIEGLVLQSEIMDLRADDEARAEGLVIDAKVEKGLGVVADCIIRWGKLELGDYVLSDVHGGKVRILNDVNNKPIKKAGPSQPVRIIGLKTLPKAGDAIICVQSEEMAKEIISRRESLDAKSHRADSSDAPLDVEIVGGASKKGFMTRNILKRYGMADMINNEDVPNDDSIRIPIILKADADGTLSALRDIVLGVQDESKLDLCIDPISMSIGHVTPSDVRMAAESGAAIFCFNLKGSKDKTAMSLAASENVAIRSHDVIYHLLDEAKEVFSTFCPPTPIEKVHGKAKVQAIFDINNNKDAEKVAGLMIEDGTLYLDKSSKENGSFECKYRVKRGDNFISPGGVRAKSLRRVKEEVESVRRGEECGLNLGNYTDVQEGDIIECFSIELKRIFV